ncbi:restriction endonuclease subunit S [Dongia sp.]|uniref:restriction endonuclease subunit S n=1 Tax=Dongia sp. TaxID=1977262 RepID=UPI0035B24B49
MSNKLTQATLEDLCIVDWGNTKLTKAAYVDGGEYLAVSAAGCDGRIGHKEHIKHTPVLSAIGAQCGKMFFPEEDFTAIKNTITLTPREGRCIAKYLYYLLTFVELPQRGAGQPFISKGDIQRFEVNYHASPPEQQRIVGILDKAFDGIATAKANAEKNLQNAEALFDSSSSSWFANGSAGWSEQTLEELVDDNCALSYGIVQPGEEYPDGLPIVRPTDLRAKIIELQGLKRIAPELAESYRRTTLRGGDLLLCVRGSTGVVSVASAELEGANVTRGIVPIHFDSSLILQELGYHLLRSEKVQSQIRAKTYGAALMQINIGELRQVVVPVPPKSEQKSLVAALDQIQKETERLASIYQQKLTELDALKSSLLHQAFTGAL